MKPALQFYIDVSGQPKEDIYIGLISIQNHQATNVIKAIKKKFPWFFQKRKKAATLKQNEIDSIVSLLNGLGVRMVCTYFKSRDWKDLIEFCGKNKEHNYEKIFAALYFHVLKKYSKMNESYPLTVCIETFMDIDKVIAYLRDIASSNKLNFQISKSQASFNDMLKVADIVAAIGRKDRNASQKYNFVEFSHPEINTLKEYLKKFKWA